MGNRRSRSKEQSDDQQQQQSADKKQHPKLTIDVDLDDSFGEDDDGYDEKKEGEIQIQRRKLSVSGLLVGDVEGRRFNPTRSPLSPRSVPLGPHIGDNEMDLVDIDVFRQDEMKAFESRFVALSKKGVVPYNRNKVNQDAYIAAKNIFAVHEGDLEIDVFGVLDGHGEYGHHVSGFIAERLVQAFVDATQEALIEKPETVICKVVRQLNKKLNRTRINSQFSGTTLVFSVKIGNTLYTANVGDSRGIVMKELGDDNAIHVKALSRDHKLEEDDEKERILSKGGRVKTLPGPPDQDLGPLRVWLADVEIPGLAMSRSIGDRVAHSVGVSSEPEIMVYQLEHNDRFLVYGSDGVWEFLSNEDVSELVHQFHEDLELASQIVVQKSVEMWNKYEPVVDDITCVIVALE